MEVGALYDTFQKVRTELLVTASRRCPELGIENTIKHVVKGSIKFPDAYVLAMLLRRHKPARVLEVGSYLGFSTRWICEICAAWKGHVTAVDPNIRHRVFQSPRDILLQYNRRFLEQGLLRVETAFFGEPFVEKDISWRYAREEEADSGHVENLVQDIRVVDEHLGETFDFIFIDGAHHYDAVSRNFDIARQLLAEEGVIAFHDAISWEDVNAFLNELIVSEVDSRTEIIDSGKILLHPALKDEIVHDVDGIGYYRSKQASDRDS